eukprot:GHUV01054598.1.p1 GENE.GHUV01054598.1~~GHUV01054598.1.p1  ORF type:complete len:109 (+),score=6.90 GHUV01054598.1:87-413(+)
MVAGSSLREYPQVYGLWANEGGVGKTTLAFHLATTYAKLCPDKKVVVIDMSPQCHLSAALLTRAHLRNNLPVIGMYCTAVVQQRSKPLCLPYELEVTREDMLNFRSVL